MNFDRCREAIEKSYRETPKRRLPLANLTAAAVLVPFFVKNDETHLLFVKRTHTVRHHKGQIAFPGGVRDDTDTDLLDTALRETHEEIGIRRKDITPLAEMDDMITPTNYRVTPFAGSIPYPYELNINPQETDEVISIPLSHLLDSRNHRLGYRRWLDKTYEVHYYDYEQHCVWGVTGWMVHELLERLRSTLQL